MAASLSLPEQNSSGREGLHVRNLSLGEATPSHGGTTGHMGGGAERGLTEVQEPTQPHTHSLF